jgi:CheY-like chemotaxis protein/DNA-binding XRE family transcriptional regulator
MVGLKQEQLAKKAGLSVGTLNNIERGVQLDPKLSTLRAIQNALEAEGIEFTNESTGEIGIRLKALRKAGTVSKLLLIDDNISDRKLFKAWLNKSSASRYSIIEAANAAEGYDAFITHQPDAIVLDFMMYGANGFQLLIKMKSTQTKIPPIMFVSATSDPQVERDVRAQGVQFYFNKNQLTQEIFSTAVEKILA